MANSKSSGYRVVDYAKLTTNDPNPVKRKLQNIRLSHSIREINRNESADFRGNVLDFGAGNGELCKRLASFYPKTNIYCYEPSQGYRKQAEHNLAGIDTIRIIADVEQIKDIEFSYILCLEVFEHLPEIKIIQSLELFERLLKVDGKLIIGVPVEIYFPALFKGVFRMYRRYGDFDATLKNVLLATIGVPPKDREIQMLDDNLPYIFRHMGYDYRRLKKIIANKFKLITNYGSPFPGLPISMNFENYYVCQKI